MEASGWSSVGSEDGQHPGSFLMRLAHALRERFNRNVRQIPSAPWSCIARSMMRRTVDGTSACRSSPTKSSAFAILVRCPDDCTQRLEEEDKNKD